MIQVLQVQLELQVLVVVLDLLERRVDKVPLDHLDYQDPLVKDKDTDHQDLLDHWETPDPLVTKVTEVDQVRSSDLATSNTGRMSL